MPPTPHATSVVFSEPVLIAGLDGALAAGEYDVKTDIAAPSDPAEPQAWIAAIRVHFVARTPRNDPPRPQSLPLSALAPVTVRDARTGRSVLNLVSEAVLADPVVARLLTRHKMSKAAFRDLLSALHTTAPTSGDATPRPFQHQERAAIQRAENEGMPVPAPPGPKAKKGGPR